jgi:hypothetical protein
MLAGFVLQCTPIGSAAHVNDAVNVRRVPCSPRDRSRHCACCQRLVSALFALHIAYCWDLRLNARVVRALFALQSMVANVRQGLWAEHVPLQNRLSVWEETLLLHWLLPSALLLRGVSRRGVAALALRLGGWAVSQVGVKQGIGSSHL